MIKNEHCEPLLDLTIFIDENENIIDNNGKILIKYKDLKKLSGKLY